MPSSGYSTQGTQPESPSSSSFEPSILSSGIGSSEDISDLDDDEQENAALAKPPAHHSHHLQQVDHIHQKQERENWVKEPSNSPKTS